MNYKNFRYLFRFLKSGFEIDEYIYIKKVEQAGFK